MTTPVVAAFDFDGTLTARDTLLPFLRDVAGRGRLARALARNVPGLLRAARDRGARDVVKEQVLASCLSGLAWDDVDAAAGRYAPRIRLRTDVVATLRSHQAAGHEVLVVSASPAVYVARAVTPLGVEQVLATELEVVDGVLTGRFAGRNCRAEEKVARLDAWLGGRLVVLHAYGNSPDDAALLDRADHAVWV